MVIVMYDGSELECNSISVYGSDFICDDYRIVPIIEVNSIEESSEPDLEVLFGDEVDYSGTPLFAD